MVARGEDAQQFLFGDDPVSRARALVGAAPVRERAARVAAALPESVRLGTASWAFPGWRGLVYGGDPPASRLARWGLPAYASHPLFRTVSLDRAFYQPLAREQYRELAALVPPGFRFLVKAHQSITRPFADDAGQTFGDTAALAETGVPNPRFLDAAFATDRVVGPAASGLGAAAGPIVFQFPRLDLRPRGPLGGAERFLDLLAEFLSRLPRRAGAAFVAVEPRNRELLSEEWAARYAAALFAGGAAHCFLWHPAMPPVAEQAAALDAAGGTLAAFPGVCIRWLLRHTETYEGGAERYKPFDRLVDEDPEARGQVADLAARGVRAGRAVWVIADNKAEGSAPLTLERLGEEVAARL